MADPLDIASEREELARAAAIANHRQPAGPSPTGRCLWCDDIVGDTVRWCCVSCRDEWQNHSNRAQAH